MKESRGRDVFVIMFGFTFFSGSMLIGRHLADGLSFNEFLICVAIGGIVLGLFGGLLAYISCKTKLNLEGLLIESFGQIGSRVPSLLISITQIGWYGVGISMFAVPVAETLFPGHSTAVYVLIVIFGLIMTASTFQGLSAITRLSYIAVPVIALFGAGIIVYSLSMNSNDSVTHQFGKDIQIQMIAGIEMVIGSYISGSITTPNFTWNATSAKSASFISGMAFFVGNGLMFTFGALSRIISGGSDIFDLFEFYHLKLIGVLVLGLNIWSSCDNGLYSASLGFERVTGVRHQRIMLIAGMVGTVFSLPLYNHFVDFLSLLNRTLPHVGVIIILSYFFRRFTNGKKQHFANLIALVVGATASLITHFGIPIVNGMLVTVGVFCVFTIVLRHINLQRKQE